MSYRDTVARSWRENVLFTMLLELTYRCNLDCFFCYNDLELRGRGLRISDYERLLDQARALGCLHLILSGGEPLVHPDFFAIGRRSRELGFVLRVKSNGHTLSGERLQRLVDEVDPFVVEISLHGAVAATHDRQTRVPGSFERLVANLAEMKARGLRVKLNATLTRWNEEEIAGMFALADGLGHPLRFDPEVTPRDDGDKSPLTIAPSEEGLRRLFTTLTERRGRGGPGSGSELGREREPELSSSEKHCGAGSAAVAVDPFGNVYPCVAWRRPVGNLHERGLDEIWLGNDALEEIRHITAAVKNVTSGLGEAGKFVSFCPGAAETLSGDPLAVSEPTLARGALFAELAREGEETFLPLHPSG